MKKIVLILLALFLMMGGNVFAGDLEVTGKLKAQYLVPRQGTGDPYYYLRFSDGSTDWGGLMLNNSSTAYGDGNDVAIYTYGDRDLSFYTGTGNFLIFPSSGGKVGIGIKTPRAMLDVDGDAFVDENLQTNGNVGIGIDPVSDAKLYVHNSMTDVDLSKGAYIINKPITSTNGTYRSHGLYAQVTPIVNSGVTNSGYAIALEASPLYTSSESGTLNYQMGARIFYGNSDGCGGTCGAATINNAIGLNIVPVQDNGVIDTSYAILINEPSTGAQVNRQIGIYQDGASMENYFEGFVRMVNDLDMTDSKIKRATVMDGEFHSSGFNLLGLIHDKLISADKKYTVTSDKTPFSGWIPNIFDGDGDSAPRWNDADLPITIEIDFGGIKHYWNGFALHFPYNYSVTGVKIEKYYDSNSSNGWDYPCDNSQGDLMWATAYETTDNASDTIITRDNLGSGICKFRVTLSGTANIPGEVRVGEIAAWQYYYGQEGAFVRVTGDTMYGNLDVEGDVKASGNIEIAGVCFAPKNLVKCDVNGTISYMETSAECTAVGTEVGTMTVLAQCP